MIDLADAEMGVAHARWFVQHKRRWPLCLMVFVATALGGYAVLVGAGHKAAVRRLPETKAQVLALAPPPVPDAENAALVWRQAFALRKEWNVKGYSYTGYRVDWSDRTLFAPGSVMRVYLNDNMEALRLADKAADMVQCNWQYDYNQAYAMPVQDIAMLREMARLCALRARVAAFDNNWALVERSLQTAGCAADHAITDRTLMTMLVAIAVDAILVGALDDAFSIPGAVPTDASIEGVKGILKRRLSVGMPHADALETERRSFLYLCDQLASGIHSGSGYQAMIESAEAPVLFGWYAAVSGSDREAVESNYSAAIALLRQRRLGNAELDAMGVERDFRAIRESMQFHLISPTFAPSVIRSGCSVNARDASLRLAFIGLNAYSYCRTHNGKWPASLEELGLDPELLRDPCGESQSKLRFKVDPKDGSLWLWSVGNNGKDDSDPTTYKGKNFIRYWREEDVVFHIKAPPAEATGERQ